MKSLKIASIFILSMFLFTITSCDDEPLEGEFLTEDVGSELSCVQATQNLANASATYGTTSASDANYAVICNAYAVALQDMINACGDDTGGIQTILDALDCPAISEDCVTAQSATVIAETAYNADPTDTNLCLAYKTALENEITQCGDADGSLQDILDGLICENTNPSSDLLLKQMIWTESDGTVYTDEFFYDGNKLTSVTENGELAVDYVYENDLLARINNYGFDGTLEDYVETEYNASNQLIAYTVYITNGNEGLRFELAYNTDGTITEKEYSGDFVSQTSLISEEIITIGNNQVLEENNVDGYEGVYTYDDKNGIYKNISNLQTLNLINVDFSRYVDGGQNNLLSLVEDGNAVPFEEYVYTYNSSNYPETSMDYVEGVLDSNRQYIYE
ncbi:hypothetical protein [Lacinutrix himadriensis]|uniref:hypothetical protein n=1 Tax=Lacinutrix himadriensis TaxID=641549 RepID=UPI0006E20991|nr:hypothetical protein [Lacinutrix himadriensis]